MRSTRRLPLHSLALAAALPLAGCGDAITQPDAFGVAAETRAALTLSADLPTLGWLVNRAVDPARRPGPVSDSAALVAARALWLEAQGASDPAESAALLGAAYERAAPGLAAVLDSTELAEAQGRLDAWIDRASGVSGTIHFPGMRSALEDGRRLLAAARAAAAAGDRIGAVEATLRAADRLVTTTPGAIAMRLIREAEGLVGERLAAAGPGAGSEEALILSRAERLLRGSRQALGRRDYPLAMRRAYYAAQLLRQL